MATLCKKINGMVWKTVIPNYRIINVWPGCVEFINDDGYPCDTSYDTITGLGRRKPSEAEMMHQEIINELQSEIH